MDIVAIYRKLPAIVPAAARSLERNYAMTDAADLKQWVDSIGLDKLEGFYELLRTQVDD